jgi:rod shape-determining protein MreC
MHHPARRPSRRRLLALLVGLTALVMVVDLAGGPGASALRSAGATVLGPLERAVAGGGGSDGSEGAAAAVGAAASTAAARRTAAESRDLAALLGAPATRGAELVPARVVAVGSQGVSGPERVTIDAGSRDGVEPDLTVVSVDGLVGRVVSVAPWTADVLVLGSADLTVGVRVGRGGALASLTGAAGAHPRPAGLLSLALVQRGEVAVGDAVTTMGSAGGRPFRAGVPVGRVTALDASRGQLAPTAAVTPAVDTSTLDIVGVLLAPARTAPRRAVTGGSP